MDHLKKYYLSWTILDVSPRDPVRNPGVLLLPGERDVVELRGVLREVAPPAHRLRCQALQPEQSQDGGGDHPDFSKELEPWTLFTRLV